MLQNSIIREDIFFWCLANFFFELYSFNNQMKKKILSVCPYSVLPCFFYFLSKQLGTKWSIWNQILPLTKLKEFQGISFPNAILSVHKLLARKFNVKPIELEATKNLVSFSSNLQSECLGTKCHQSFEIENTQDFSIFWSTNTLHMKVMQRNFISIGLSFFFWSKYQSVFIFIF